MKETVLAGLPSLALNRTRSSVFDGSPGGPKRGPDLSDSVLLSFVVKICCLLCVLLLSCVLAFVV